MITKTVKTMAEAVTHAPCDIEIGLVEKSTKLHPSAIKIRNKRKRMRLVRALRRKGITSFLSQEFKVTKS